MTEEEPEIMSLLSASRAGNEAASARLDAAVYSELSAIAAILLRREGQRLEAAFGRDQSLYHGQLLGYPFRSVVKTFQVRVWRELKRQWQALDEARREQLAVLFPLGSVACLDGLALEPA